MFSILLSFPEFSTSDRLDRQIMNEPSQNSVCASRLEIDRYIGLPIFFPIFKHFTIIGYRFCKKNDNRYSVLMFFFFFFFFIHTYIIIQSITSSEILTYIRPIQVHTHLEQCSLRRSSSTTTVCNFIQD